MSHASLQVPGRLRAASSPDGRVAFMYNRPKISHNDAFDAGGIKDWLRDGHNGYLVPWMDRTAFAAGAKADLAGADLRSAVIREADERQRICHPLLDLRRRCLRMPEGS